MKIQKVLCFILFLSIGLPSIAFAQVTPSPATAAEMETKSLEELYEEAIKEGGEFVLRAGGDKPDQIDYYLDMFKKRFPKLNVTHTPRMGHPA
ncbi:MAG: hypothetical protein AAFV25_13730 [Bacteroidota bacterium]